ncbi:GIY-YIG nuclease family protein [Nostoc sp. FACHB-973]|nr:GIY-YIG nuclease family protein [Nostoc sp. FACHB-973]
MFINPFQLPSVHLSQVKELPSCTAIYFAIDSKNRVLYIGQAINLLSRWKNHHREHQLQEIDKDFSVRIAWQAWNEEGLSEAEKFLINSFQPLLNGTEVKTPTTIPSEFILRDLLKLLSRRLIIIGVQPKSNKELPNIHLKYDWKDCSPKGTAAKIKSFIEQNKDKNTSLKIRRKPYGRINPPEIFRPGSRAQKVNARENRSYNNHWYMACNGSIIHITPTHHYRELKEVTVPKELAGIKLPAVTTFAFSDMKSRYRYEFSGLSCFESDLIPLLWVRAKLS